MTLQQVNAEWTAYKERMEFESDELIEEVAFDAPEEVEAYFDLIELLSGKRILHMTKRAHIYRTSFVRFILTHEFTHLYDFLTCPFPPEKSNKLLLYMQSYSEYHACRVTLKYMIDSLTIDKKVYINKNQIPTPYKDISIRRLLEESLFRAKYAYEEFYAITLPNLFVNGFRQLMYLYGYISLLKNDMETLEQTLRVLRIDDGNYLLLYKAMQDKDVDHILEYTQKCFDGGFILFLKKYIRSHYDPSLYTEEELDSLTPENYEDYMDVLDGRRGDDADDDIESVEGDPMAAFIAEAITAGRYPDCRKDFFETMDIKI